MTAKINLLPWRKEIRDRNNMVFGAMVGACSFVCVLVLAMMYVWTEHLADTEQANVDFLRRENKKFDLIINQIKNLQDEKNNLINHMNVIQALQKDRGSVVSILDGIIHAVPEGLYLTKIERRGPMVNLEGVTDTNSNVSDFMDKLQKQYSFATVDLKSIQTEGNSSDLSRKETAKKTFQLSLTLSVDHKGS